MPDFRLLVRPDGFMDSTDAERVEGMLATTRFILAVAALVAIYIDPTEPTRYYFLSYSVLFAYVVYSLGVLVSLSFFTQSFRLQIGLHFIDVVGITFLIALTQGPNSPFFVFFTFVVLSAAYRWGFRETLFTGLVLCILFVSEGVLLAGTAAGDGLVEGEYDLNRFIMRSTYLLIVTILLSYLAYGNKRMRAETSVIIHALGKVHAESGLRRTLEGVLEELRHFTSAGSVLLAVIEKQSGRAYLMQYKPETSGYHKFRISEIFADQKMAYFFPADADAWHVSRHHDEARSLFAIDERGKHVRNIEINLGKSFDAAHQWNSILVASVSFGEEFSGRIHILNPQLKASREVELRFLQRFVRQAMPAIYNVYLSRRLQAKIGATERMHIARDLHDGVVQSLIALALHIDGQKHEQNVAKEEGHSINVAELIRNEICRLRALINELRTFNVEPHELVPFLVDFAERFERDTGIHTRVLADNENLTMPPRVCREIAAIVREALNNVRKHSGARNVLVRFSCENGLWTLVIDDDGRGFDFCGRLCHEELERLHQGPIVIKERVRLLKGQLTIESKPDAGSRLEISSPLVSN